MPWWVNSRGREAFAFCSAADSIIVRPAMGASFHNNQALLAAVSRSFFLTIRALPGSLQAPIATAYLLARATDTLADTDGVSVEERLSLLRELREVIRGSLPVQNLEPGLVRFRPLQKNAAERVLLERLAEVWEDFLQLKAADQAEVRWVLEQITQGQEEDLLVFGAGGGVRYLADAATVERYTWLVAGSVGEFWTRLCARKWPRFATLPTDKMRELGADFGRGLQLVNILRDRAEDLAQGRSYLPKEALVEEWMTRALFLLDRGWEYVLALRDWRLRFACALPVLIGVRTLRLLKEEQAKTHPLRVKVSRGEVRRILWQTLVNVWSRSRLEKIKQNAASSSDR